jgi:hypothetical protein
MANTESGETTPESYRVAMEDLVSIVAKETGWRVDYIMDDMSPMELFSFTKSIARQYEAGKNTNEFLGSLSKFKGSLG